jgi:hypothetical protein
MRKTYLILLLGLISSSSPGQTAGSLPATQSDRARGLFQSIRSGSTDALAQQLRNGANLNDTLDHYSALMAATLNGSTDQMQLLIDHGANVNYVNSLGISALWLAVPDKNKTMLLLDHGADLNLKIEGYGVLAKLAAMPGTINFFHWLIDKGADLKKCTADNSLVYIAAASGDTAILGFLLRSGFRANDTVAFGDYPINSALNFRSFATLKMLVDSGADVNVQPMTVPTLPALVGFTPLMSAALSNDKPSFLYLLGHGANPNLKNKKGFTALMLLEASEIDDPDMTLALLQHGAVPAEKAPDGSTALYYAEKKGNTPSVAILKKYENK